MVVSCGRKLGLSQSRANYPFGGKRSANATMPELAKTVRGSPFASERPAFSLRSMGSAPSLMCDPPEFGAQAVAVGAAEPHAAVLTAQGSDSNCSIEENGLNTQHLINKNTPCFRFG